MPARFLVGCLLLCAAVEVSALCAVNPYKAAYQKTKFSPAQLVGCNPKSCC